MINNGNIVVNGLRDPHEADHKLAFFVRLDQGIDSSVGAVTSNNIQLVDTSLFKSVKDLLTIESATTGT